MLLTPIATFCSPFESKFGIPRQSGLAANLRGEIVFEPEYRNVDFLRGIEEFDFLWLLWEFSANRHQATSPVVRPPLLGGNERVGVFATRSPFRPNPVGLSSVRLDYVEWQSARGPVVHVLGADLMDGTPIFDIKPYIVYADSHPDARSGFVDNHRWERLSVEIPTEVACLFNADEIVALQQTLELDPRPHYHNSEKKVYGMPFAGYDIRFCVSGGVCRVTKAVKIGAPSGNNTVDDAG